MCPTCEEALVHVDILAESTVKVAGFWVLQISAYATDQRLRSSISIQVQHHSFIWVLLCFDIPWTAFWIEVTGLVVAAS